ncbi:unnamed protein product [Scytosiphon promiscuus]
MRPVPVETQPHRTLSRRTGGARDTHTRDREAHTDRQIGWQKGRQTDAKRAVTHCFYSNPPLLWTHPPSNLAYRSPPLAGQMQNEAACKTLEQVLENTSDDSMVRHEAAEALGAIGACSSVPALERFTSDPAPEVSQTCQLALDLIAWRRKQQDQEGAGLDAPAAAGKDQALGSGPSDANPYLSVDPAPSCGEGGEGEEGGTEEEMGKRLRDQDRTLFERYRAMFSLRNRGGEAAALELASAFDGEENSLFKHEVAYVLGQMQHPATVTALGIVLADLGEHQMVRHEAAEALGAIGGEKAVALLKTFMEDDVAAVKESCEVALDTMDYWSNRG